LYINNDIHGSCFITYLLIFPQFQPKRQRKNKNLDFDPEFKFVSTLSEYNHDTWDDMAKYVKRKAKNKLDDKIEKLRKKNKKKV
jgi:ATP-dependent RNA helicase DDX27